MNYIPLYIKTSYSLLSSLCDIKKLVHHAKGLGIKSLAITDNNMFGAMEFYKECISNGIKPIIGLEIEIDNKVVLLYAKNYKGYQNLTRLTFIKQDKELDINDLKEHSSNILCIVLDSELYKKLSNIYVNLYLGYNNKLNSNIKNLVYINKVLCIDKEDVKYINYLGLIKDGKKLDSINDYNEDPNCYLEYHLNNDFKIEQEISDLCNIEFIYNPELFPVFDEFIN